jgi:hypothetical protein
VKRLSTFVAAFAVLLAGPALARPSDVVSGNPSVKALKAHGETVISFKGTAGRRLYQPLEGRHVRLTCQSAQLAPIHSYATIDNDDFVAPKHSRKLRATLEGDWCEVVLVRKHDSVRPIVAVPITPAGAVFLEERGPAVLVDELVKSASVEAGSGSYPTTQLFVARHPGIVALASPSDPVAPGEYGFYSDGAGHIEAVGTTAAGKRLFEEVNGDTIFGNVFGYVGSLNFG